MDPRWVTPPGPTEPPTHPASPHSCLHIREAAPEPCRFPLAVCVLCLFSQRRVSSLCRRRRLFLPFGVEPSSLHSHLPFLGLPPSVWCCAYTHSFARDSIPLYLRHVRLCQTPPLPTSKPCHRIAGDQTGPDQTNADRRAVPESVPLSLKHSASLINRHPLLPTARAWHFFTHFDIYSLLFDT